MATVTPVNANNIPIETQRTASSDLGKDEFLQILSVQLSNQDPLEPVSDTDFIAQMAQFSSLEQMQAMASSTELATAYDMIGKDIVGKVNDALGEEQTIMGRVNGVMQSGGTTYVVLGANVMVPLDSIKEVYDNGTSKDSLMSQAAGYIDKYIEAEVPTDKYDSDGNQEYEKITGQVEYIFYKDGFLRAKLKDTDEYTDKEVMIAYINKVSDVKPTAAETDTDNKVEETESGSESEGATEEP